MITVEEKSKINKKVLGIIGLIVLVVLALTIGIVSGLNDDSDKGKKESYDNCIELNDKAYTGATFTMDFSEVKAVIGRELSVGDLNSSTGGWQLIYSGSDMKEYSIGSSSGIWKINIVTDLNDNVIAVACKTVGLNNNKPNDSEMDSFASVFAEITGYTQDSIKSILRDLCESNNLYNYQDGILLRYVINNGFCEFIVIAATEEYLEEPRTDNGNGEINISSTAKISAISDFVDKYNHFFNNNLVNDDDKAYKEVLETITLKVDYFQVYEKDRNVYTAKYSWNNVIYAIMLYMNEKQEIAEVRVGIEYKYHPNGETGAYNLLRVVSYGCIYAFNNDMSKDEIAELFKNTWLDAGKVNEYRGMEYYAMVADDLFSFIITVDEELFIGETPSEEKETTTNQENEMPKEETTTNQENEMPKEETTTNQENEMPKEEATTNQETVLPQDETAKKEPTIDEYTTSENNTLEEIETESQTSTKAIKLSEFKEYDSLLKEESHDQYIVEFDNEVFNMWIDNYTTELTEYLPNCMWSEENVVIIKDFTMNSNIGIHIFAFDEVYGSDKLMNAGAQKIFIEFRCVSSSAYRYDVENTKELYDFILTLAKKMKEKYPVNN